MKYTLNPELRLHNLAACLIDDIIENMTGVHCQFGRPEIQPATGIIRVSCASYYENTQDICRELAGRWGYSVRHVWGTPSGYIYFTPAFLPSLDWEPVLQPDTSIINKPKVPG